MNPTQALYTVTFVVYYNNLYPVEGALVSFNDEAKTTDYEGKVNFYDMSPGNYSYIISADGFDLESGDVSVDSDIEVVVNLVGTISFTTSSYGRNIKLWPIPSNDAINISFSLEQPSLVIIDVYSAMGIKVKTLLNSYLSEGLHIVVWSIREDTGLPFSTYIIRVRISNELFSYRVIYTP